MRPRQSDPGAEIRGLRGATIPLVSDSAKSPKTGPAGRPPAGGETVFAPVYGAADLAAIDLARDVGEPGAFPFTRGIYREMYRRRLWTMRQYAGFSDAAESNRRYRYLLSQGTSGLSVAFDLPTQIGYDSDHALASGEVGRVGVAIDSIADMRRLFEEIPLDRVTTSMTINATAPILLAFYLVLAEERSLSWESLGGTVQNDILKEYAARGTYIYPPGPSLRLATDLIAFSSERLPRWNPISISGYHMREAGSTAVQEIAFTIAHALAYVDASIARGLAIDDFAPRLSFFFNAHNNFLEEVAKFRAARRLWAELLLERYAPRDERSLWMRFHTQTAGSTLTAQQPDNNVVRVAIQALAAVCGGTQSLHTNARDEALGLPTESSARLALRTQQVIASESGVAEVTDPLGGSWAIEALTDDLAARAREYILRIDAMGGALAALERGFQQDEIAEAAFAFQRRVEEGTAKVVGVNCYEVEEEIVPEPLAIDPQAEARQVERLREFRRQRDPAHLAAARERLALAAAGAENLMPAILDCVRASATLGEISDTLRGVFGEYAAGSSDR
jgi:methylmalonyl-CoA mutase N-terminal domain/subunit